MVFRKECSNTTVFSRLQLNFMGILEPWIRLVVLFPQQLCHLLDVLWSHASKLVSLLPIPRLTLVRWIMRFNIFHILQVLLSFNKCQPKIKTLHFLNLRFAILTVRNSFSWSSNISSHVVFKYYDDIIFRRQASEKLHCLASFQFLQLKSLDDMGWLWTLCSNFMLSYLGCVCS